MLGRVFIVLVDTGGDGGGHGAAQRAQLLGIHRLDGEAKHVGEQLNPHLGLHGTARHADGFGRLAGGQQLFDVAAVGEGHALVDGAQHVGRTVEVGQANESRLAQGVGV